MQTWRHSGRQITDWLITVLWPSWCTEVDSNWKCLQTRTKEEQDQNFIPHGRSNFGPVAVSNFFPLVTMALHNKMKLYVPGEPELLEKSFMVRRDKDWGHNDSVPAVNHGGGNIMHCGCCVACGTDTLHTLDGIVKEDYFQILNLIWNHQPTETWTQLDQCPAGQGSQAYIKTGFRMDKAA